MSIFVPKGPWRKPTGFVEGQKLIDSWWEKNKDKRWSPTLGLYDADLEPTDEQLKEVEKRLCCDASFRGSINRSFKHLSQDQEKFVVDCEKTIDNPNHQGYVSIREVVCASVTSTGKTPARLVPSSTCQPDCVAVGNGNPAVVPESVTSSEMNGRDCPQADSIPSLC